jgi:hypothetical protein
MKVVRFAAAPDGESQFVEANPRLGKNRSTDMSESATHYPPEFKHAADMEWEMGRFGNVTKFLFHPRPERPAEPNAGFLKYAPGASFPLHRHDFAQIWYIIEGEFSFAGKLYKRRRGWDAPGRCSRSSVME